MYLMLKSNEVGFASVLIVLILVVIAVFTCAVYLNNFRMMVLQKNDVLGITSEEKLETSSDNLIVTEVTSLSKKLYSIFR